MCLEGLHDGVVSQCHPLLAYHAGIIDLDVLLIAPNRKLQAHRTPITVTEGFETLLNTLEAQIKITSRFMLRHGSKRECCSPSRRELKKGFSDRSLWEDRRYARLTSTQSRTCFVVWGNPSESHTWVDLVGLT